MSDTNPNDVERALAAFGANPIKYRSFGRHHLQTAASQMPLPAVIDDTVYDPFGPQPVVHSIDENRPATFRPASAMPLIEPEPPVQVAEAPVYVPVPPAPAPAPAPAAAYVPAPVAHVSAMPEVQVRPVPPSETVTIGDAPSPVAEVEISAGSLSVPPALAPLATAVTPPEPVAIQPAAVAPPAPASVTTDRTDDEVAFLQPASLRTLPAPDPSSAVVRHPVNAPYRAPTPPTLPSLGMRMASIEAALPMFGEIEHRSLADMFKLLNGRAAPIRRLAAASAMKGENSLFRRL